MVTNLQILRVVCIEKDRMQILPRPKPNLITHFIYCMILIVPYTGIDFYPFTPEPPITAHTDPCPLYHL